MAQQLGTVIYALKRFWPGPPGQTAAVFGAGPAGLHFVQLLKHRGFHTVIATDLSPARLDAARTLGADITLRADDADPVDAILDLTAGRGADLTIDAAGRDQTCTQAMLAAAAAAGVVGLYGLPEHARPATFPFDHLFPRQPTIAMSVGAQAEPHLASFRTAIDLITSRTVTVHDLITHTLDIDQIDDALVLARNPTHGAIKVCLRFRNTTQQRPPGAPSRAQAARQPTGGQQ